jgi:predicted anti-sigma-YlaC factor YlaD
MMNCRDLIARLDDLNASRLRPSERLEAEKHLAACGECRDLQALIAAGRDEREIEAPPGLLDDVMARTSGDTCRSAHRLLCDHVDGALDPVDDELLRLHLNDCAGCAGTALALARLTADLPALAVLQPDDRFVIEVLARTTRRERFAIGWAARLVAAGQRLASGWQSLMQRPRFAFEGAYLGVIFLVLLFGIPTSPLAGVPQQALGLVRGNPVAGLREVGEEVAPTIRITVRPRWKEKGAELAGAARDLASDVARRSSGRLDEWKSDLGTLWDRLTSEETSSETNGTADGADRREGEE